MCLCCGVGQLCCSRVAQQSLAALPSGGVLALPWSHLMRPFRLLVLAQNLVYKYSEYVQALDVFNKASPLAQLTSAATLIWAFACSAVSLMSDE